MLKGFFPLMTSQVSDLPSPDISGVLVRELSFGVDESHDIVLANVTCGEAGLYACHLAAPVGEQNREGRVLLTLTGESDTWGGGGVQGYYDQGISSSVWVLFSFIVIFFILTNCINTLDLKSDFIFFFFSFFTVKTINKFNEPFL